MELKKKREGFDSDTVAGPVHAQVSHVSPLWDHSMSFVLTKIAADAQLDDLNPSIKQRLPSIQFYLTEHF